MGVRQAMNCSNCGDPLPTLLSTYGAHRAPMCARYWFTGRTVNDDPIAVELESLTLQSVADTVYEPTFDDLPPVDMLAPGWANLPVRQDADATVTADPSVEDH